MPAAKPHYSTARHRTSPRTVGEALHLLLQQTCHRVRSGARSPATLAMQRWHASWWERELGKDTPIAEITQRRILEIGEALAAGHLSPRTVAKRFSTLRRALRLCVLRGELPGVPLFPEVANPAWRPRVRILETYDDYLRLLAALPPERADWVAVAVWTIQRPGDVERMRWSDVSLEATPPSMRIRSTKTRRPDPIGVKVPGPLVTALRQRRDRLIAAGTPPAAGDPLVAPWPGRSHRLPIVAARIGLPPLTPMDLRHTGISWMVRRTGLTVAAQRWGGWTSFQMMQRFYAHALPDDLAQAADELASIAQRPRKAPARATGRPAERRRAAR